MATTRLPGAAWQTARVWAVSITIGPFPFHIAPEEWVTMTSGRNLQTIERFRPDVIVTHSSGAMWKGNGPIVMDTAQTLAVCQAAPGSRVVAIHLDSLDHGEVTREDLRAQARVA